jgi:hypothetical protein
MKIHVNTDGTFDVDLNGTDNLAEAAKFIREIQRTHQNSPEPEVEEPVIEAPKKTGKRGKVFGSDLNSLQYNTWTWLIEHDTEAGVHFTAMARDMEITEKAATQRLARLAVLGYAERVGAGKYRAKC